jgi:aarF domain-containing kinase
MLPWLRALPSSRRRLSSFASSQLRHSSYRVRSPTLPNSRSFLRRPTFWLFPFAGGILLYLYPTPQPILSQVFASPTLIPCPSHDPPTTSGESLILSPSEHDLSISEYLCSRFIDHIWEPILTARRFIHLFFLFFPVILSSPMLLVGSPEERLQGDRWGAVWWYGFLVAQMDRAGPTFIKVGNIIHLSGI